MSEAKSRNEDPAEEALTTSAYDEYWQKRVQEQNIEEGYPERNDPAHIPADGKISPHTLGTCHRKQLYRRFNAPAEDRDPHGIFWMGKQFENQALLPFLQQEFGAHRVSNDLSVEYHPDGNESILISGTADPTIVDENGQPELQTEVKTQQRGALAKDEPSDHHYMQLVAYIADLGTTNGVMAYMDRQSNRVQFIDAPFKMDVYHDVINWAETHSAYVRDRELPPADPEESWECQYCDFKERCGKGEAEVSDMGWRGFTPLVDYPRPQIEAYLEAADDPCLTPTIAANHPDLVDDHDVLPWTCPECKAIYEFGRFDWDGDTDDTPDCPNCLSETGDSHGLSGEPVRPDEQKPDVETGDIAAVQEGDD